MSTRSSSDLDFAQRPYKGNHRCSPQFPVEAIAGGIVAVHLALFC
jgi:hypothetical protein